MPARTFRFIALALLAAAAIAMAGCEVVDKATTTTKELGEAIYPADKKMSWFQTKREQPTYIMTAHLSIPQANAEKNKEIGIKQFERITWSGQQKPAPELVVTSSSGIAALPGQCNGSMSVDAAKGTTHTVVLNMRYFWQTTDQVKGRFVEDVEVRVGQPAEVDFESGAVLKVDWKKIGA